MSGAGFTRLLTILSSVPRHVGFESIDSCTGLLFVDLKTEQGTVSSKELQVELVSKRFEAT